MTKFLDDQWCADRDIIEMKDLNTWWADEKVSSLDLSAPLSILPTVTVEQAIDIMVREGFDQLPVITESGKIVGVATMGSLKAKLLKVSKVYKWVSLTSFESACDSSIDLTAINCIKYQSSKNCMD